jgi:Uma2 family endonuclease
MNPASRPHPILRYPVAQPLEGWELSDEKMPESVNHDAAVTLLKAILEPWAARRGAMVARNLAIRWNRDHPRVGLDPDVGVLPSPPPYSGPDLRSVKTWLDGHYPPLLAIEVVSNTEPRKDYVIAPDKYAASGTQELWIFDPALAGPKSHNGPWLLQVWQRDGEDFGRIYQGEGPAYSPVLDAYAVVIGHELRIADDLAGRDRWPTVAESERERAESERQRAESERERAESERERAESERERAEALARKVAELEARLRGEPDR